MLLVVINAAPRLAGAVLCGDLNASGTVTSADTVLLFRAVLENPDPAPLCGGAGALNCGDVAPVNNPNGVISTADVTVHQQSDLGGDGASIPPAQYLVCYPGSCESQMTVGQWQIPFGGTMQTVPPPFEPPTSPAACPSGSTLLTSPGADPILVRAASGYTGSPRVTDASFAVAGADLQRFGHIFVGSAENNPTGGRIGVAVGDIGYAGTPTTMYIEFVRKSGDRPGCFVMADGLDNNGTPNDPSDDTWGFYPGNGGIVLPPIQGDRWYRIASIAGRRDDGGVSVTVTWQDLTTLQQVGTSYDFPASCTPTWWDTADHRPQYGIVSKVGFLNAKALIGDLFIRPPRF
jgi:hypothetical protein